MRNSIAKYSTLAVIGGLLSLPMLTVAEEAPVFPFKLKYGKEWSYKATSSEIVLRNTKTGGKIMIKIALPSEEEKLFSSPDGSQRTVQDVAIVESKGLGKVFLEMVNAGDRKNFYTSWYQLLGRTNGYYLQFTGTNVKASEAAAIVSSIQFK